jgi:hypothetical protein
MMPDQVALFKISTEATVQCVEAVLADRRIMIDSVATALSAQRTEGSRKNDQNGCLLSTFLTECR